MKSLFLIIACIASLQVFAQEQEGIAFEELPYAEALAKAKQENKHLFVDCYTTWCVPCKYMATNVFTRQEAGEYFAPRFVAVKYDMENGEGVELKKQFGVQAYPTFLIIQPDGTVAHRIVGRFEWPEFAQKLERGLHPATRLNTLETLHAQGKLDSKGLRDYRQALEDAYEMKKALQVSRELFARMTPEERVLPEAWPLLSSKELSPLASENYDFILENREKLSQNIGSDQVDAYLYKTWIGFLSSLNYLDYNREALGNPPPANHAELLQQLKRQIANMDIPRKEFLLARCAVAEAKQQGDRSALKKAIEATFPFLPPNDDGSVLSGLRLSGRSREAYAEMADLYESYLKALPEGAKPEWVQHNALIYRKQSHAGLYFESLSFAEALAWGEKRWQAPVYVWVYAGGDAACSAMEREVFAGDRAGEASRSVVCIKCDLSSPEGLQLIEKYNIPALSSFHLLLSPDGAEISRLPGAPDETTFLNWLEQARKRD